MKLAVIGSRNFNNYNIVEKELNKVVQDYNIETIVSGGATGADALGKKYAYTKNLEYIEILPEWNKYGKRAGFVRNTEIWNNSDMGIAFWDGFSKGTSHSFDIAKKQGKVLFVYNNSKDELVII